MEEQIDIILPERVKLEPRKEEKRLRRKNSRKKTKELLEQMRRFEKDEEWNEEMKDIIKRVDVAAEEIEGMMVKLEEV